MAAPGKSTIRCTPPPKPHPETRARGQGSPGEASRAYAVCVAHYHVRKRTPSSKHPNSLPSMSTRSREHRRQSTSTCWRRGVRRVVDWQRHRECDQPGRADAQQRPPPLRPLLCLPYSVREHFVRSWGRYRKVAI